MIQVQPTEGPFGLIIAPSRELAHQTYEAGCRYVPMAGGDGKTLSCSKIACKCEIHLIF